MVSTVRFLFLQMRSIEKHQPCQLKSGGGRNYLAVKAALDEQREAATVVEMGMSEKCKVDRRWIEAKRFSILLA